MEKKMEYVKLSNGNQLDYAPRSTANISNYNIEANEEMIFKDGWKRLVRAEAIEGGVVSYIETETTIEEVMTLADQGAEEELKPKKTRKKQPLKTE